MTTTVTRADREAAARLRFQPSAPPDVVCAWAATGDAEALLKADGIIHDELLRYADRFAIHRAASTQALREAADSLANAADACVMGHCTRDDMMPAIRALRSALAAETKEKP